MSTAIRARYGRHRARGGGRWTPAPLPWAYRHPIAHACLVTALIAVFLAALITLVVWP